ncbi:Peptidase pepE [Bacillus subtilis]|nr:Peptidase pepE [Bacillus subtilis]
MMKQIIAMGGGGFSMEPDNLSLDQYILNQSKREQPRICFLPTASGDSSGFIMHFKHWIVCRLTYLCLSRHQQI